jgi:DNA-binding GntR family transcriptional regulator
VCNPDFAARFSYDGAIYGLHTNMSQTTTDRLYHEFKQEIVTCQIAPGLSLSEKELCDRYSASRTPVREACRRLESEKLIHIVPYRGYMVTPVNIHDFHSLHEIQLILDPPAAALAAVRATPAQLKAIELASSQQYRPGDNNSYYMFLQRNLDFHVGIADAAHNEHLLEATIAVQTRLMRFFYLIIAMDAFGPQLMDEHAQLVDALRRRDPEAAREAAVNHVRQTNRRGASIFTNSVELTLTPLADYSLTT